MYKLSNDNSRTEILLYSLIEGGTTAGNIIKHLGSAEGEITLRINSDGGEVFDAIAMYNYLKAKDVTVIIDGICASAASIVAMSGKTITMTAGSMMMIHNPCSLIYGDSETHKAESEVLSKISAEMAGIYSARTGLAVEEILSMMDAETWMTSAEALERGFIDAVEANAPQPESVEITDRYEEGILAERARIKALDELYTPGRALMLHQAKYVTMKTAQDIAVELLKREPQTQLPELSGLPAGNAEVIDERIADIVGKLRRRNNVRD